MICPHCTHCRGTDRTTPEAIALGHQVPGLKQSKAAFMLQVRAPKGSLERILQKLEETDTLKGTHDVDVTLRIRDGQWVQTRLPQPDEVIERKRA